MRSGWKRKAFYLGIVLAIAPFVWIAIAGYLVHRKRWSEQFFSEAERDLRYTIIPDVDFKNAPFREVMDFIVDELNGRGTSNGWSWSIAHPEGSVPVNVRTGITLQLHQCPAGEVLGYSLKLANAVIEDKGERNLVVYPPGTVPQERIDHTYRVSFEFFGLISVPTSERVDVRKEISSRFVTGITFGEDDFAWFFPDDDKLIISLPRDQMDLFELITDGHHIYPEPTLIDQVSFVFDWIRTEISGPPPRTILGPPVRAVPSGIPSAPPPPPTRPGDELDPFGGGASSVDF